MLQQIYGKVLIKLPLSYYTTIWQMQKLWQKRRKFSKTIKLLGIINLNVFYCFIFDFKNAPSEYGHYWPDSVLVL